MFSPSRRCYSTPPAAYCQLLNLSATEPARKDQRQMTEPYLSRAQQHTATTNVHPIGRHSILYICEFSRVSKRSETCHTEMPEVYCGDILDPHSCRGAPSTYVLAMRPPRTVSQSLHTDFECPITAAPRHLWAFGFIQTQLRIVSFPPPSLISARARLRQLPWQSFQTNPISRLEDAPAVCRCVQIAIRSKKMKSSQHRTGLRRISVHRDDSTTRE